MAVENTPIDSLAAACKCCMSIAEIPVSEHVSMTWTVYVPIISMLALVIIMFALLLRKYTFKDWGTEENPYKKETFGMPRGVMRGILTITILFTVIILELVNLQVHCFEHTMNEFLVAFQMMIAFYFGSKVMHHATAADKGKTESMAASIAAKNAPKQNLDDAGASG